MSSRKFSSFSVLAALLKYIRKDETNIDETKSQVHSADEQAEAAIRNQRDLMPLRLCQTGKEKYHPL